VDRLRPWNAPLEIPDCPEGWVTGPPEYVGIGAQRCGTSWWYDAMRRHPAIERSPIGKEVHYFDRFWQGDEPENLAEEYASLFPRPPGQVTGEWTPRYLADFWTAPLLRRAAPEAKLLVMFRDPVARYRSAVARLHRLAAQRGDRVLLASVSDATWRGFYHQQLSHVVEFFPREQVLVLQFERCVQDPVGEMERTWRFVGLEPPEKVPGRLLKHKQAGRSTAELAPQISSELAERYGEDAARLAELCPEIDLSLWQSLAEQRRGRATAATPAAVR
jgi:Sulfotransferase family